MNFQNDDTLLDLLHSWANAKPGFGSNLYDKAMDHIETRVKMEARPVRTDQEIVNQTEDLASAFAQLDGYQLTDALYREHPNPRAQKAWEMACMAQAHLTDTDVRDAVLNLEDKPEPLVVADKWKEFAVREHFDRFEGEPLQVFEDLCQAPVKAFTDHCIKPWPRYGNSMPTDLACEVIDMAEKLQRLENEK